MDFRFTREQEEFRATFAAWLAKNLPDRWDPSLSRNYDPRDENLNQAHRALQRRLCEAGYAGLHYPKKYGGQDKTLMEEVIVSQELAATCWELRMPGLITFGMAAPTIRICGTKEQKREFLPKILNGTHIWSQGFSEPNAGSDLANLATQAVRDNGHYVVNGQKVWTTFAHFSDYCLLLARSDPDSTKHKGLSYFLVDMKSPGIEVRPIRQITGESAYNEVFFDNVHVPAEMRLGEEGQGWQIAITTLMFERTVGDMTKAAEYRTRIQKMMAMAATTKRSGQPVISDPVFRQQLAQAYIDVMVLKYYGLRNLNQQLKGNIPGPEGSVGKLLWSDPHIRLCESVLGMQGPNSQVMKGSARAIQDGYWQYHYLESKSDAIAGGTSEVLLNVIGERVLGLPKD